MLIESQSWQLDAEKFRGDFCALVGGKLSNPERILEFRTYHHTVRQIGRARRYASSRKLQRQSQGLRKPVLAFIVPVAIGSDPDSQCASTLIHRLSCR